MWKLLLLFLACLFLFGCSSSKPKPPEPPSAQLPAMGAVCHDFIGLLHPQFPTPYVAALATEPFCGSHLDWTFGNDTQNLELLLNTGKVAAWQVDIYNGPCINPWNSNCGSYEPHAGLSRDQFRAKWERGGEEQTSWFRDRVRTYCDLFKRHPGTRLQISPILEHTLSREAWNNMAANVRDVCPSAELVNNNVQDQYYPDVLNETHNRQHNAPVGSLFSYDGNETMDSNVPAEYARMKDRVSKFYIWSWTYNGRCTNSGFVDPRNRSRWPNKAMLADLFFVGNVASGRVQAGPTPAAPISHPRLWKPWADDHCDGNPRNNKPVYLTPWNGNQIDILGADRSTVITSLKYAGRFGHDNNISTYRSGIPGSTNRHASEIADKAVELTGSPWVYLREGSAVYGPFHPSMRQGYFR